MTTEVWPNYSWVISDLTLKSSWIILELSLTCIWDVTDMFPGFLDFPRLLSQKWRVEPAGSILHFFGGSRGPLAFLWWVFGRCTIEAPFARPNHQRIIIEPSSTYHWSIIRWWLNYWRIISELRLIDHYITADPSLNYHTTIVQRWLKFQWIMIKP